jgi:hypothetical protein
MSLLQDMIKVQGTTEECQMYQEQLQGLQETKSLCKYSPRVINCQIRWIEFATLAYSDI